jgi:hypothetical protein
MPLDIQSGSLVEKLRRALGLRGRIPLRLDETIVPIVTVDELGHPPNRSVLDAYAIVCAAYRAADVANFSWVGMELPANQTGAIVVHGTTLCGSTAGARLRTLFLLSTTITDAIKDVAGDTPKSMCNGEFYPPLSATSQLPNTLPWGEVQLRGVSVGAFAGGARAVGWMLLPASESRYMPLGITLRPGWALAWYNDTINQDIRASFHATYYPTAPSS